MPSSSFLSICFVLIIIVSQSVKRFFLAKFSFELLERKFEIWFDSDVNVADTNDSKKINFFIQNLKKFYFLNG